MTLALHFTTLTGNCSYMHASTLCVKLQERNKQKMSLKKFMMKFYTDSLLLASPQRTWILLIQILSIDSFKDGLRKILQT